MKLLVVAPNWIGDAIMAQPLLRLLRARWPQAHIAVLAPPHVAPVFECMDEVAQVLPEALAHGKLQWRARVAIARRLRGEGDDQIAAAVVLDVELILEGRLGGAAQRRQLRLDRQLGRQAVGLLLGARQPLVTHVVGIDTQRFGDA